MAASRAEPEIFEYQAAPRVLPRQGQGVDFYQTAEAADQAQEDEEREGGGAFPKLTRRIY